MDYLLEFLDSLEVLPLVIQQAFHALFQSCALCLIVLHLGNHLVAAAFDLLDTVGQEVEELWSASLREQRATRNVFLNGVEQLQLFGHVAAFFVQRVVRANVLACLLELVGDLC